MTFQDRRGLELTAKTPQSITAFEDTMNAYLRLSPDAGPALKTLMETDPGMVMANVLKGAFLMLQGHGGLLAKAQSSAEAARAGADAATPRERAHVEALTRWVARDLEGACTIWEAILLEMPQDLLALRFAHYAHFYSGDARRMRGSLDRVMPVWGEDVADYSYVLGMRAFALEEAGVYAEAEAAGRRAIELNPEDPWSVHAVAHVMEMEDRHQDGLAWIDSLRPHWTKANNFRFHVWWHEALVMLDEGRLDAVLALYDREVFDPETEEYLDICNAASLLQRLEILGVNVGGRWAPLAEKVRGRTEEHVLTFIDLHFALILAAAGDTRADEMREFMAAYEGVAEDSNLPIMKALGVPLVDALIAYREGAFARTRDIMLPLRYELWQIGGSHAQRDLFDLILIDAVIKAGDGPAARALLAERQAVKPDDPWTRAQVEACSAGLPD